MGLIVVDYNLIACVSETRTLGSMNCIFYNYPDVFGESLGSLPGKVHLVTKQSACAKAVTNFWIPVSMTFFGNLLTCNALRLDPEKVKAIHEMSLPNDVYSI